MLRQLRPVLGLLLVVALAIALSPLDRRTGVRIFLTPANITDILRQVSEIGIMALAMTFVILTAGIDLSVGSLLALAASLTAKILTGWDSAPGEYLHIALAISATLAVTTLLGAASGLVISRLRMQPFIVTLAVMIGVRGLARWLTDNANIDLGFGDDTSSHFADMVSSKSLVIGTFLVLAVAFTVLLRRTVFGRYVRALGDNAQAARFAGLPTGTITIAVYALSGFAAGLAGVLHCAQNHQGSPNDGMAYELEAIAAVVIGGTSLAGGKGSVFGTVVGTMIMGVLTNLFRLRGVDINVEMMVKAVIILVAVRLQSPRGE